MRKGLRVALAMGVLVGLSDPAQAQLLRKRGPMSAVAGNGSAAVLESNNPSAPQYSAQKVTGYRPVQREREVDVVVQRVVPREVQEQFTYTEMVPRTTYEKRPVTEYQRVERQVPYTFTEMQDVTTNEKRPVTEYQRVERRVPYTFTESVPVTTYEPRRVTTWENLPRTQTEVVSVRKAVLVPTTNGAVGAISDAVPAGDDRRERRRGLFGRRTGGRVFASSTPSGPGYTVQYVTQQQPVTRTVIERVPRTEEFTVPVTTWQQVQRQGTRTVAEMVPVTREVIVPVTRRVPVPREGMRTVAEMVPVQREVSVPVTTFEPVERTGTRTIIRRETVTETIKRKQVYTEMEPYKTTVQVPVGGVTTSASAPSDNDGRRGLFRGVLFGRRTRGG